MVLEGFVDTARIEARFAHRVERVERRQAVEQLERTQAAKVSAARSAALFHGLKAQVEELQRYRRAVPAALAASVEDARRSMFATADHVERLRA
jgi:hypothetical protein